MMTSREAAEKHELEMVVEYFAKRTMQLAGDAAEMKAALERAIEENTALKAILGNVEDA